MKNPKTIKITSLKKGAQVTIRNGSKKLMTRRFASIDDCIEFVQPQGDRQTDLYLNGYPTVLAGWVLQTCEDGTGNSCLLNESFLDKPSTRRITSP